VCLCGIRNMHCGHAGSLRSCGGRQRRLREAFEDDAFRQDMVSVVQTFGEAARFHPHVHALCSRGGWNASGEWIALPYIDTGKSGYPKDRGPSQKAQRPQPRPASITGIPIRVSSPNSGQMDPPRVSGTRRFTRHNSTGHYDLSPISSHMLVSALRGARTQPR
jgi:hypothetical protein